MWDEYAEQMDAQNCTQHCLCFIFFIAELEWKA